MIASVPDLGVHPCAACGSVRPAAIVLRATETAQALCPACGTERERVLAFLLLAGADLPVP